MEAAGGEWWMDGGSGVYHRLMNWWEGSWRADCGRKVNPTQAEDHRDDAGAVCANCHALNDSDDPDDADDDLRLPDTDWRHNVVYMIA
jgi:hypothetical protein